VSAGNLTDIIGRHGREKAGAVAFRFLGDEGEEVDRRTYGELERDADAFAQLLAGACEPGERVALLYTPGIGFIASFLGCWRAGMVPVPLYPPLGAREITVTVGIVRHCGARAFLTDLPDAIPHVFDRPLRTVGDGPGGTLVVFDDAPVPSTLADPDVALLQYTSGSTGQPKGVVVTHGNLVANQARIQGVFGQDETAVVASWLPMYHDMGLIGSVLHTLYLGATAVLMSPITFMRRPFLWLDAISRYRATISPAPNFGYELCVRKVGVDQALALDLSSWEVACNGAEPVRPETLERFSRAFHAAGFRPGSFAPCYGLAEATLLATGIGPGDEAVTHTDASGTERVSCGPVDGTVTIEDDEGRALPDGEEGHIVVRGPSVARGYWDDPGSDETFRPEDGGRALRTGDLGIVTGGELFVTGRTKDLLVVRGRNHHPHDIETTVQAACPTLAPGCVAVFGLEVGGEEVAVAVGEPRKGAEQPDDLLEAAQAAVAANHGITLHDLAVIASKTLPKSSSGKLRRSTTRGLYVAGELDRIDRPGEEPAPDGDAIDPARTGEELLAVVAAVLDREPDPSAPLTTAGLDSVRAVELQHELEQRLGVRVSLEFLLDGCSVTDIEAQRADGATPPAQTPATEGDTATVSLGEQALIAAGDGREANPYVLRRAFTLPAPTDAAALRRALEHVVDGHDALRTVFTGDGAGMVREVRARTGDEIEVRQAPQDAQDDAAEVRAAAETLAVDPRKGPVFRCVLATRDDDAVGLAFAVHHAAVDFASTKLVLDELRSAYAALVEGDDPQAGPDPGAASMSAWLGDWLRTDDAAEQRRWWREHLASGLPQPPAPSRTTAWEAVRASTEAFSLETTTGDGVAALAQRCGATPMTVCLAAYAAVLSRLFGMDEVVVAVQVNTRRRQDRRAVGYFVNTIPVRVAVPADQPFPALVATTHRALTASLDRARVPLALIAADVRANAEGDAASRLTAFPFSYVTADGDHGDESVAMALGLTDTEASADALPLQVVPLPPEGAVGPVGIELGKGPERTSGRVTCDGSWGAAAAEGVREAFLAVLDAAVTAPDIVPADLPLVGDDARRDLVALGTVGESLRLDEPGTDTLLDLFDREREVDRDRPAVEFAGETTSYGALGDRADAVAAALAATLPSPGGDGEPATPVVGILLRPGTNFVVAVLASWRAGAAFLPLLADQPDTRIRAMAEDAGVSCLVTEKEHAERARDIAGALPAGRPVVDLDEGLDVDGTDGAAAGSRRPGQHDVAYVVYTSGTTGRPKGVPVTHANVLPFVLGTKFLGGVGPSTRLSQTLSLSFDFGLGELFSAVSFGGTLCIPQGEERPGGRDFHRFLTDSRVNALYLTPTLGDELLRIGEPLPEVRLVHFGGEPLHGHTVDRLRRLCAPDCLILNGYGPTEVSISVAQRPVPETEGARGLLPVGPPVTHARMHVVDRYDALLPRGFVGELLLAGPGVVDGYVGQPEATREKFLRDPIDPASGDRAYRTGDLARWNADGDLEILGRTDDQVKVRGFRVELGEVEAGILALGVDAAAVAVEGDGWQRRLVAFVCGADDTSELRRRLGERLPGHLVPNRWVKVDRLPRTSSGKADRARLLAAHPAVRDPAVAATGGSDRTIDGVARIWSEALEVDDVDRNENFFDLGGHSLLAGEIVQRTDKAFGLSGTPTYRLFEHPTVASFAAYVDSCRSTGPPAESVVEGPRRRRRPPQRTRTSLDTNAKETP
jgi:amino acid adenylation domain-containing protein